MVAHANARMGLGGDLPENIRREVEEGPDASHLAATALLAGEVPKDSGDESGSARLHTVIKATNHGVIIGRAGNVPKEISEIVEEARQRRARREMALDGYVDAADEADWS